MEVRLVTLQDATKRELADQEDLKIFLDDLHPADALHAAAMSASLHHIPKSCPSNAGPSLDRHSEWSHTQAQILGTTYALVPTLLAVCSTP